MKSAIATRIVPARDNFVFLSKGEMERQSGFSVFAPRAIFYRGELFPIEVLNSLTPKDEVTFVVVEPTSDRELVELALDAFRLQGGSGEIDTILLMDFFLRFNLESSIFVKMVSSFLGKSFDRNLDFYLWSMGLDKRKKQLLIEKGISLRNLYSVKDEAELEDVLFSILTELRPNGNRIKSIITFGREISVREDISYHFKV